ncbi:substrate-binding periplasmic protein [Paludibacterium purpuratum]|uniref:Amino acid ABC transporter substrate-binding protein (PAAT family) n=1 Tax=Paludibacterium purpuratum TaxID=1144873 RepID=A0A4V3DUB6_9NEIS|nr:transporter substrate-binding domain-containing protein [Paludibacterium purpuratum]TDR72009.1 amino acid ABC transporter substrate-binding protein (PAAT family) [Paludibacterium purpuratum]
MYRWLLILLFWLPMALAAPMPPSPIKPLTLLTESYPPFNDADSAGNPTGISTHIVTLLMQKAGLSYSITVVPWVRAITLAKTQANHCVFSMSRTPEREASYQWIGPLVYNDWALFAKVPADRLDRLEQIGQRAIGSYQGDAIVAYLASRGYNVDATVKDELNPDKLLVGHIAYWATGKLIGQYILRQQGRQNQIEPILVFNRTEMYLACHRSTPEALVSRLNALIREMRQSGEIERIYLQAGYSP